MTCWLFYDAVKTATIPKIFYMPLLNICIKVTQNDYLSIYVTHQDDYLSNFYEDYKSSLSTIYHYARLALQRNFLMICFLLQLSWKEYPPWHVHHHLNQNPTYTVYWNLQLNIWLWGRVTFIFVSEINKYSVPILVTFNLLFQ